MSSRYQPRGPPVRLHQQAQPHPHNRGGELRVKCSRMRDHAHCNSLVYGCGMDCGTQIRTPTAQACAQDEHRLSIVQQIPRPPRSQDPIDGDLEPVMHVAHTPDTRTSCQHRAHSSFHIIIR
jgi:hypothetical protein